VLLANKRFYLIGIGAALLRVPLILTCIVTFSILSGTASAAEAPASSEELRAASGPPAISNNSSNPAEFSFVVAKDINIENGSVPTVKVVNPVVADARDVTAASAAVVDPKPTPVISAEIKDAEYVPPVEVKPTPAPKVVALTAGQNSGNRFPYGYCTWYVASKREISWMGNAGAWYGLAQADGMKVGNVPAPGAIMVTRESYLGHVALVDAVNADGSWTVSEMNYDGWGVISSRTIRPGTISLVGFIY
jgi:surface antigen